MNLGAGPAAQASTGGCRPPYHPPAQVLRLTKDSLHRHLRTRQTAAHEAGGSAKSRRQRKKQAAAGIIPGKCRGWECKRPSGAVSRPAAPRCAGPVAIDERPAEDQFPSKRTFIPGLIFSRLSTALATAPPSITLTTTTRATSAPSLSTTRPNIIGLSV